jgi:hypothetical protein
MRATTAASESLLFFFPREGAFDTAGVDGQTQLAPYRAGQRASAGWVRGAHLGLDERHHLGGELVGTLRAALLRQQSGEPLLRKRRFGLIERGTGNTKESCGLGLLHALEADLTEHLVLHLHQIARIEEAFALEPGRPHSIRMPVQCTLLFEVLRFGIALGQGGVRGV